VSIVAEALASEEESDDPGSHSTPLAMSPHKSFSYSQQMTFFFFSAQVDGDFCIFDPVVA
jgi:hypothetical protein